MPVPYSFLNAAYIYVAASIGMGHNRHNVFVFVTWRVWCPPNMTSSVVATKKKNLQLDDEQKNLFGVTL